jgi:subtilisin
VGKFVVIIFALLVVALGAPACGSLDKNPEGVPPRSGPLSTITGQVSLGSATAIIYSPTSSISFIKPVPTAIEILPEISDLITRAQREGSLRVIVRLNQQFVPEGYLNPALAKAQKDTLAYAQQAVLQRLPTYGVSNIKTFHIAPLIALQVDAATLSALANDPLVAHIEEDIAVPPTLAESIPVVDADLAWAAGYDGTDWSVAVLDTGVDRSHSFLAGKVISEACYSSTTGESLTVCPSGEDASTEVGSGVNCSLTISGCNHGTHVAGIVAGTGTSFSGVASGGGIIAIQVFSRFDNYCAGGPCVLSWTSDQILGLQRVLELHNEGINIASVNMSLGGGGPYNTACDSSSQKSAIDSLMSVGIATVIATGNNGFTSGISSPACISSAVSVGSTNDGSSGTTVDTVSSFSNSGDLVDLLAPGAYINSSVPEEGFSSWQGTSMATPHIAGAWAVMREKFPSTADGGSVSTILNCLDTAGVSVTDSRNGLIKPRLDLDSALNCTPPPPPPPPSIKVRLYNAVTGNAVKTVDANENNAYSFDGIVPAGKFFIQAFVDSIPNDSQDHTEDAGAYSATGNAAVMNTINVPSLGTFTADITTGQPGESEPNEGFETDNILLQSTFLNGEVIDLNVGPFDFFALLIPKSGAYTVETFGDCIPPYGQADTILTLYNKAGMLLATNDDKPSSGGYCSRIDFTATGKETYYLRVSAYQGWNGGELPYTVGFR